jgi:hypothetical protein
MKRVTGTVTRPTQNPKTNDAPGNVADIGSLIFRAGPAQS